MFARDEVMLGLGFETARARLVNLTHGGWLAAASDGAYADGLAGLIRVGPFGAVPGASKLVSGGRRPASPAGFSPCWTPT